MPPRMKDIAAALGVSVVTVSKVLKGKGNISEETTRRVRECAERLGYRTNQAASALVTGKSKIIGLIVPELVHGFFAEVAASLLHALHSNDYGLVISSSRDSALLEREEILQMAARGVDALVIASCEVSSPALQKFAQETPVVLLDRRVKHVPNSVFVGSDDIRIGTLSTQHLLEAGYRRIAYIGGSRLTPSVNREAGYRATLKKHKIKIDESLILTLSQKEEVSQRLALDAMRQMLRRVDRPDGVVCYNDAIAHGVVHAALRARLRVPQDFGVVGCGYLPLHEFMRVPLTTIDQKTEQLGSECALAALSLIEHRKVSEGIIPVCLIRARSTRKIRS